LYHISVNPNNMIPSCACRLMSYKFVYLHILFTTEALTVNYKQ
jgi:hypothetical protein